MRSVQKDGLGIIGLAAAPCVACCAGPILAFLGGLSIAGLAGTALFGAFGLLVVVPAIAAVVVVVGRRLPHHDDIEADVREFAVVEKGCCQFWGFEVEVTDAHAQLRWDGPPDTDEFLDRLLSYFAGEKPITAIEGLL